MQEFEKLKEQNKHLLNEEQYKKVRKNCSKIVIHFNNDNFDEAVCDICLDGDEDELENGEPDKLLICEVCYVVVHQG
jgi:hypothetical protein